MKTQILALSCALAALLLLSGCGSAEPAIWGTVNLDGKPVPEGDIRFVPLEGSRGADAGAVIRDGKYKVVAKELATGKYRVSIRGYRPSGIVEPDPLGGEPLKGTQQFVPKEYQGETSVLVKELTPSVRRLDFDLVTSEVGT